MTNDILGEKNEKNNDNYKCFNLILTKTHIVPWMHSYYDWMSDGFLIAQCFKHFKSSFVECLILNNVCKDYSRVVSHCTQYSKTWKLDHLKCC